jgi:hypothetical protein
MPIDPAGASGLLGPMRLLLLFIFTSAFIRAAAPAELSAALSAFKTEPPAGWSFTQTSSGAGKSTVERFDAAKPEFERWTLLQQDGRTPTADETKNYAEGHSRRSRGGTAPNIGGQLDLNSAELVHESPDRVTYRCRLKTTEAGDKTAEFLRATVVIHRPTKTIESFELASTGEFKPVFGVKVAEMRTTMTYSLPAGDTPSLPQKVIVRMRGRAFLVKSLDADMAVTFSDYLRAERK